MTRVSDGSSQKVDGNVTVQVEVVSKTDVTNVDKVNLVVIHTSLDPITQQFSYDATAPAPAPADQITVYTFIVPQEVLPFDQTLTILVMMRNINDKVTAYSEASVTFKGKNTDVPSSSLTL